MRVSSATQYSRPWRSRPRGRYAQTAVLPPLAAIRDDPPPPVPPDVISRDSQGRATLRAVRISQPVDVDGRLQEPLYGEVCAASDFLQEEPDEGAPATDKTEVWVLFDDQNIYVAGRCWETHPERRIANDMRRDGANIRPNDNFAVIFDTFYDRQSGFLSYANPIGGMVEKDS